MKFNIVFTTEPPKQDGEFIYFGKNSYVASVGYVADKDLWNAYACYTDSAFDREDFAARSVLEIDEIMAKIATFRNEEVKP